MATAHAQTKVDFIVTHATIYTVDSNFSVQHTLVIHEGKIIACGSEELLQKYQADSVWDAQGLFLYPGFIDAHCHFSGYALSRSQISLEKCTTVDEVLATLKTVKHKKKGDWIQARQWDDTKMKGGTELNLALLDKKFPEEAVCIMRIDGHSILCNTKALTLAGMNTNTVLAGKKLESVNGKLTGWLRDEAMQQVLKMIPEPEEDLAVEYMQKTEEEFFKNGLTSFVDCMVENSWMHDLISAYDKNKLRIHGHYVLTTSADNINEFLLNGRMKEKHYSICGFKVFADGTLGSKSAAMLSHYQNESQRGHMIVSRDSLLQLARLIHAGNLQLMVHAIGDSSNRMVLNVMAEVLKKKNDRRWRIEHAQVVNPQDLHVFGDYSIIPSVQPTHALSDMRWLKDRIGIDRAPHAYRYHDLLKQNGWFALGTDFPVEPLDPLRTYCAAVFRKNEKKEPITGFQMENAVSREEALKGMTIWAAKSVFDEKDRGSIEPGKEANFVILPVDLMKADMESIYQSKVLRTYMSGRRVY